LLIVALTVFFPVKGINRLKDGEAAPPAEPTTKACPFRAHDIPIPASRCPHCTPELASA
jgi:large conductance mechanosensitive channel